MRPIKKMLSMILCLVLALPAVGLSASAARVSEREAAQALETLGFLRGDGDGLALERDMTRAEAVVMQLRLLGRETEARNETAPCPYLDGGWAAPYLTYAWRSGLVQGRGGAWFGSGDQVGSRDYLTMVLRAMGYNDAAGDFSWSGSVAFADAIGLTHGEYTADTVLLRGDVALITYTALTLPQKGTDLTLAQQLYLSGTVSAAALKATRLSGAVNAGKQVYTAAQIYERSASAVFLAEIYEDEKSLERGRPDAHGSGFFVTADGVALLNYHELDGYSYLRAVTTDDRRFDITEVLFYDPGWDIAVVRVSRTDTAGETVRFFPYLDLGDSDAVSDGDTVYTVSNALGLVGNITNGVIANKQRNVDDPDYLCLQVTAPISSGSSGGALLDQYGEVIGVLYGSFIGGQNMNLAVPVNCLAEVSFQGEGVTVARVKEIEDEKKAKATLSVSQESVTLGKDDEAEILVTHDCPGRVVVRYNIDDTDVVECEWGDYVTKHSIPLYIRPVGNGKTEVTVTFTDGTGNEEARATVCVTVTGVPEESDND